MTPLKWGMWHGNEKAWHTAAARRMRVLMRWPVGCNDPSNAAVLSGVKALAGGEPLWVSQSRVFRALKMTADAIARGHQR